MSLLKELKLAMETTMSESDTNFKRKQKYKFHIHTGDREIFPNSYYNIITESMRINRDESLLWQLKAKRKPKYLVITCF